MNENKEHRKIFNEWKRGQKYTTKALAKKHGKSVRMINYIIKFYKKLTGYGESK